jgi:polysaccharide chain length determinant protein (PEP-CTERM system associated)
VQQTLEQLQDFLRLAWRGRWTCLAVAWAVALLACLVIVLLPSRYESTARIYADTDGMLGPLLRGITVETDLTRQLDVMQRTILSRPNLERVIDRSGLASRAPDPIARERLIAELRSGIRVTSQGWNLFTVAYRDRDPAAAQRVVAALLEIFVATNLGVSREELEVARRFIDEQIAIQGRALDEAERKLADFQKRYAGTLPGEQGYFASLLDARRQIAEIRRDLDGARAEQAALQRQLAGVPPTVSAARAAASGLGEGRRIADELALLRRRLVELKARYTDRHPDVLATEEAIAALEGRAAGAGDGTVATTVSNPVYEQIRVQIAQKEAEIANHESRLARAEAELARLEAQGRTMPETEAELKRLTRDYEVIKRNYDELLARREAARIAQEVDARTDRVSFRVVEPPTAPLVPASPPRLLMLAAVPVLAGAAGVGTVMLRGLVLDPFGSVRKLQRAYPLKVLGAVSEVVTPDVRARRRLNDAVFAAATGLLFALVVGVAVAERLQLVAPLRTLLVQQLAGTGGTRA